MIRCANMPLNTLTYTVAHVACLIQNHCVLVATLRVNVYCCRHETFRITQLNSSGGSTLQWGARRRLLCEFLYLDDFIVVFLYTPIAIRNLSSLLVIWIFLRHMQIWPRDRSPAGSTVCGAARWRRTAKSDTPCHGHQATVDFLRRMSHGVVRRCANANTASPADMLVRQVAATGRTSWCWPTFFSC